MALNPDNKTLAFYDEIADSFAEGTVNIDFADTQERFLSYIPERGIILDFGCGAGRDTKYFLERGYQVDAIDGSEKLCKIASEHTGIKVRHMLFSDLDDREKYDGIWACASILHLPKEELKPVMEKIIRAVKPCGYIYTSFKYGDFEGVRKGRYFTYFTDESFRQYIRDMTGIAIKDEWTSFDVRPDRSDEQWLNLILQKTDTI